MNRRTASPTDLTSAAIQAHRSGNDKLALSELKLAHRRTTSKARKRSIRGVAKWLELGWN